MAWALRWAICALIVLPNVLGGDLLCARLADVCREGETTPQRVPLSEDEVDLAAKAAHCWGGVRRGRALAHRRSSTGARSHEPMSGQAVLARRHAHAAPGICPSEHFFRNGIGTSLRL